MTLEALASGATACRRCPRVLAGSAVLGPRNGHADSAVMFAGEAPGRFGAARTGVPFSGDTAGARFERLLTEAGLTREDVFVTNAALCLPLDAQGRNRRPSSSEVAACSGWLGETIAVVKPALVVALGVVALAALARIEPHGLTLREHVGTFVPWRGAELTALYHPGARSQAHRPWPQQVNDWQALGTFIRAGKDNSKNPGKNSPRGLTPQQS
jgi:DNA polymerase